MATIILTKDLTKASGKVAPAGSKITVHDDFAKELIEAGFGKPFYEPIEPKTFKVSTDEEE